MFYLLAHLRKSTSVQTLNCSLGAYKGYENENEGVTETNSLNDEQTTVIPPAYLEYKSIN